MYDDLSVTENLRFFARVLGVRDIDRAIDAAIAAVDLGSHRDEVVGNLSGGQRSRASLAVALLGEPDVLVLDEPTVGLDPVLRRDLWALFHRLADDGRAVLVSSHVMDEAERCDRLLLMREGEIIADGTPAEIRGDARDIEDAFLRIVRGGDRHEDHRRRRSGAHPDPSRPPHTGHAARAALLADDPAVVDVRGTPGRRVRPPRPGMLAIFPFIVMFLVTSVTTLRERSSGTLERLLSMPLGKLDFLLGYALAFGVIAAVQSGLAVAVSVGLLGLDVNGPVWLLGVVAIVDAVLGTALGLLVSAFAATEFQAVQFMPLVVVPQILLCGLFVGRDALPGMLEAISDVLPLSYAVDAMQELVGAADQGAVWGDVGVVLGFAVAGLALGAATLRRRTA